ncbi:MAG: PBP1A family penicillin-binding protein, partial [Acidobacteriota bacterium]
MDDPSPPRPPRPPGEPSSERPASRLRRLADRFGAGFRSLRSRLGAGLGALKDPARRRRILLWAVPVAGALTLGVVGGVGVAAAINMPRVETIKDYTPTLITQIEDASGEVFATYARERRVMLQEGQVPEVVQQAVVAAEDGNFFQHGGIDLAGVLRAVVANLRTGRKEEGASTLTMQLARALYLSREKRWRRKIEETFLAVELEKKLTKQQILTLYCNLMNFGHGRYGVEAASRFYFNKPASELELVEAATLAGILQRPSDYSPYRRPDLVLKRRNYTLRRMADEGYISRERYLEAKDEPLLVVRQGPRDQLAPYFAEEIRKHLESAYGATRLFEGGLRVRTTLDPRIQAAADEALREGLLTLDHDKGFRGEVLRLDGEDLEERTLPSWHDGEPEPGRWYQGIVLRAGARSADVKIHDATYTLTADGMEWTGRRRPNALLRRGDVAWFRLEAPAVDEGSDEAPDGPPVLHLEQEPEVEGAVLVLESASGAVRAMVGGWDFERSKFNRAVQAQRQVGSAFKVFVYGTALENGYTPADTIFDGPTLFPARGAPEDYLPKNHGRRHYGILTVRRALEASINVPAVKMLDMVGAERVIDFARRCGIESQLFPYPSLALGSAELRPIELAAAYAAIANQGTWVEPYLIETVQTPDGRTLEEHFPKTRAATSPQVAYVMTSMLEGVTRRGTGRRLRDLEVATAGKTGTTDEYSDAWFIGFTPRYTLLTWVGYDVKRSLGRGMDGASAALPIWKRIAEAGLEEGWIEPGVEFQPPAGVRFRTIDYRSGLLLDGEPGEESE